MAGANLSTLSTILKEYYLGPVTEQLNNEVLLLSRLEAKSEDLVGKRAYVPLHWGRSGGVGARSEAAALPSAGKQQYERAVYDLKYLYGRVEVTGPSMAKTKNEAGAFLQALNLAQKILKEDGCFIGKIFQGGSSEEILDLLRKNFLTVKYFKPESSRKDSSEIYLS